MVEDIISKIITVHLELEIEPAPVAEQAILTPALRKILPYSEKRQANEAERWNYPIREVEEFPGRDVYIPYHEYKLVNTTVSLPSSEGIFSYW